MPLERFVTTYSRDYKPFRECQLQVNQLQSRCEAEAEAAAALISPPQSVGPMPLERFVTTYSRDYKPFRECQLQVNQLQSRCEAEPEAAAALISPPQSVGPMPLERFVTTYSRDYKPFRECQLQVNQLQSRCEAEPEAAAALISPPQSHCETGPIFHHCFYKTTNSIYGSTSCPQDSISQPPSWSLFPGSLHPLCTLASYMSEAPAFVGSAPTEARTQEEGVARQIGPLLGEEIKGHLHYVFGGKANMLEQQEAKDEPQKKIDVLYEEGVIVLSSHVGPACCEELLRSVCREAGLQHLLHLPVASSPIITTKDDENWDVGTYLRGLEPAIGLKNSTFLHCAQETECPHGCCFKMKTVPPCILHSSALPLAQLQPTFDGTEPSRSSPLTEYQARYTAEPKMEQSVIHHRDPHHQTFYSSF